MERRAFTFDIKSISESGTFEGYAATYGNVDLVGDAIQAGAFAKSLKKIAKKGVPILWNHNTDEVIGKSVELVEDENGLFIKADLNLDVQRAKEVYSLMKQGALSAMSIGYIAKKAVVNKDGIRELKELQLIEVSPTPFPANEKAQITDVKTEEDDDMQEKLDAIVTAIERLSVKLDEVSQKLEVKTAAPAVEEKSDDTDDWQQFLEDINTKRMGEEISYLRSLLS